MAEATDEPVTRHLLRADLADFKRRLYRALLVQTGVIIGTVVALLRLIP